MRIRMKVSSLTILLLAITGTFFNTGCSMGDGSTVKPSYGNFAELAIFTDNVTYNHPLMHAADEDGFATVEKIFESAQPYYLTGEPYFIVLRREFGGIGQTAKQFTNVLVLVNAEYKKGVEGYIEPLNLDIDSLADTEDAYIVIKEDVWAAPQTVIFLIGKDANDLQDKLINNGQLLIKKFLETEKKHIAERMLAYDTVASVVTRTTENKFGISLGVSRVKMDDYTLAKDTDSFVWFKFHGIAGKRGREEYLMNMAVMTRPYTDQAQFYQNNVDSFINAMVKANIPGPNDTMYMAVDSKVDQVVEEIQIAGNYAKRSKGWWHYENGYGGGPLTSYTFYHEKTKQLVTCIAFFLGPEVEKTKYMRELEMYIENIKLL